MRIARIELRWFRGASENAVLNTESKSVVIYGPNASGKSSFADGLEYIIRNGKIRHLQHEYSGAYLEKGVRNTEAPQDAGSKATVHFGDASYIDASISPNGALTISSYPHALKQSVQGWSLESHLLRQDEVARFITFTKGEKYSALLPLLGLDALEHAAENLHQIELNIVEKSKIAVNREIESRLTKEAEKHLKSMEEKDVLQELGKLANKYAVSEPKIEIKSLADQLAKAIENRIESLEPEQSRYAIFREILDQNLVMKLNEMISAEEKLQAEAGVFLDLRISVLESTEKFLATVESPEEEIECPSCGRKIVGSELVQHVTKELDSLKKARTAISYARKQRVEVGLALSNINKRLSDTKVAHWLKVPEREEFARLVDNLQEIKIPARESPWEVECANGVKEMFSRLQPLFEESIKVAAPSTKELVNDLEYVRHCAKVPEIYALRRDTESAQTLITLLQKTQESVRKLISENAQRIFNAISNDISYFWKKLHPKEPIENIELYTLSGVEKAIDVRLKFFGVEQPSPRLTLSEGYRNSLGLCIFLALARREKKDEPIILDDIVSSFDREHRGMLTNLLREDLSARQVILLTHDRDWYIELHCRLPAADWKFMVLRPWESPKVGLTWSESVSTFDDAKVLLSESPEACANRVRAIMDTHLAIAAEGLKIPIEYLRGEANDRRTCVNFLDRIIGEASKRFWKKIDGSWEHYIDPVSYWKEMRDLIVAWGDPASHTGSLENTEAEQLMSACEIGLAKFRCESCGDYVWTALQSRRKRVQCSCGQLRWNYG